MYMYVRDLHCGWQCVYVKVQCGQLPLADGLYNVAMSVEKFHLHPFL